jgi:hypothetical protein
VTKPPIRPVKQAKQQISKTPLSFGKRLSSAGGTGGVIPRGNPEQIRKLKMQLGSLRRLASPPKASRPKRSAGSK